MGEERGIGELIDRWLEDKPGRTLGSLARESGLSRSYLSRLRRGERTGARRPTVGALSQALGVPVEDVIGAADADVDLPPMTFREFIDSDWRLTERQRRHLIHTYYELYGIDDGSASDA